MKNLRKALSIILAVAMLTAMIPNALAESDKVFTIQNDYVKYSINSETGGFSVETLDGNPQKKLDDNIPLLYKEDEDRSNGTSFTTIRIDGKDYIFGRSYGFFGIDTVLSTPVISEGGRLITVDWKIKDYTVTQQVALSAENDNDLTGNVGISYVVKNNGTSSSPVGIRVLMDTALDSTVDSPYLIKDTDALPIEVETEYSGENMPTQIRGVDSLEDPTKMMYTFLKGWTTEAAIDRVVVGHWRNLANTRYDYTPDNYCNFTNYSNEYRFPDSAIAYYWDEEALTPGGEKRAELLYGVGNFSTGLSEDNLGIYMSIDNKVRLDDAGDGYANDGEFEITVTVDNSVDGAQLIKDTVVTVELDEGLAFQEGYGSVTAYDNLKVGDIHTIKYKLKAEPQTKISAKAIAVSLHGTQDIDETTAKAVNYGTSRSVLLPSVAGTLPEITMNNITPGTVYTEGTKTVTVSGEMSELQALEATDMWDLYLVHTTSDSKVRIEKDKIAFTDDTYSAFTLSTDEELVVGEYKLVFEFIDAQLTEQFGVTSITAGKKLTVSNDPKYKLRSYGLMALIRHSRNQYAFVAFNNEDEYNSFLAKGSFYDINGKLVTPHDYAEMKTDTHEVILLIRGDIRESYWILGDGSKQYYYQANPDDADVIINDILKYTGDEPIMIREEGGIYKVSGDGKLSVINSITVWRDEWSFQTVKNQVTTLDSGRYGADDCTTLQLQLDGVGSIVQSIGGFLIDIKYGEMSASRLVEDDRTFAYGIGFGGRISIPIKAPEDKSKKDDAKEQVLSEDDKNISKDKIIDKQGNDSGTGGDSGSDGGSTGGDSGSGGSDDGSSGSDSSSGGVGSGDPDDDDSTVTDPGEDEEDYSDALTNLFKEEENPTPAQSGATNTSAPAKSGDKFRKDTSLDEGGLTADVEEVRFGQITGEKDDMVVIEDVGFVGINTTLSLCLPKDVLGSLVTNAPGIYAAVTINTLEDIYAIAAGLDIKAIQCEGLLSLKKTDIKNVELVVPDNIEFYIRDGLEIPLVPGVLHIGGLGGGINDLADTMGGEFTKLPPITLLLFMRLEAVQVFAGDFDSSISLSGISLDGEFEIDTKDTLPSPVVLNVGISARWISPIHFKVYGEINIIDGLISGGVSITITDKSFCGYVFAAICIPDSVPIIGGHELARVEAAIGTDYVGAAVRIIGIKIGVIYYWDGDLSIGKGVSLSSYDDEVDPDNMDALTEADMASDEAHALYGTNMRTLKGTPVKSGEVSLMSAGTELEYDFSVSEQDAVIFEIPFEGYVLPTTADFTLKNPNGVEIPLVEADSEGNGNFIVQTGRADGYFAYISVTDENQLVDGVWTLTVNTDNIAVNEMGGYVVDNIAGLESVTADYTEPYTLDVSWVTDCESDSAGYIDVYLTEDKDILSKLQTSDMDTVIGENIGRIRLDSVKSGNETFTIPDSMASGEYYVALALSSDLGGMSTVISESSFKFVNENLPSPVKSASLRYGGNGDIYVDIEDADDADYTHYLVNVVAKDGTTLTYCMDQFAKGEKVFIGKEANLQADKEYYVEVQTLKEDGEKFYYGGEIVISDTITMRTVDKPVLLSVETNVPENGIMSGNMLEVKYTFDRPVWLLGDINGDVVSERCFQEVWEISYPLLDGDYIVDFEAIGMNKDYVSASDFEATVKNARLGFVVDTIAPTLALKKNVFASLMSENNKAVETAFGSNVVVADENGDFIVEGVSEFKSTLTVDGVEVIPVNADGTFTYSGNLGDAQQKEMLFKAVDKSGNETTLIVYAISKNQSLIKSVEILNNGEAIAKNSDGEAIINLKKGESANLSVRGITQNGEVVTLANSDLLWDVLYEKNLINIADGVITAVEAGETAVKAGLPAGEVTLFDDTNVDTAIENYVIINIFAYDKTDLAAEIASAESNILVTGNASADDVVAYQSAIDAAKAIYNTADASEVVVEKAVEDMKNATAVFNKAKNAATDKTALAAEIESAESNIKVPGNAGADDVTVYQSAIDAAKAVYNNADVLQAEVDSAVATLKSATNAFNTKKNVETDKTLLATEITSAKSNIKVTGNANADDVAVYQSAIDAADTIYINPVATQVEVDNAVSALKSATEAFNAKKNVATDKTALAAEIESAESNIALPGNASADDVTVYQSAIDAAKAVYNKADALQAETDNAVSALKSATNAFNTKKNAATDKTVLAEEITKAKSNIAEPKNASEDDVAAYQSAIDTANEVYVDPESLQTEVDNAVSALKIATEVFDAKKNVATDKTALAAEIESAESNIKVAGNANVEDVTAYQSAIDAAKAIYEDAEATQKEVNQAITALKSATNTFDEKKNVATDKAALSAEIISAKSNIKVAGNASAEDVAAYQSAIDAANEVYINPESLQTEVDNAVSALKSATEVFNAKKNVATDKTALAAEITNANSNIAVPGNASDKDIEVYQSAIDKANKIYINPEALQTAVDSAVSALKSATAAFNEKKNAETDRTKLAEKIAEAEENIADVKKADDDDIETYQSAIDAAKAIYADAEATQRQVDNAVIALNNATKAFDKKNNAVSAVGGGGGGSGIVIIGGSTMGNVTTYDLVVNAGEGGNASASQYKVPYGNSVTITSVPDVGYEVDRITVNGEYYGNDEIITIAAVNGATTVNVTFTKQWTNPFADVSESDWFYENVKWTNRNGFMNGTAEDMFSPEESVTRAMLVTILYRAEGEPEVSSMSRFADVNSNEYYANAVAWAETNGIVNGYSDTEFAPDDNVLREQIAAILYRYAMYKGYDVSANADITAYDDCTAVSGYALEAVEWAVGMGIISGKSEQTIAPVDNATRAEVAAMMQRFEENIE